MKLFTAVPLLSVASLPALVAACGGVSHGVARRHHEARQAPGASSPSPSLPAVSPPPSSGVVPPPAGTPGAPPPPGQSGSPPPPVAPTTTFSFSLQATNPTAVPLTGIISTAASAPTRPLDHIFTPGSTPTFLPGAPPLPNAALLAPASYPALDVQPPIDSPEVQAWIKEVANSGVVIPNIPQTVAGGCAANAAAAADQSRCWWTCTGCTRATDITECPNKMQWGLTYDDGPSYYTSDLLNYLDQVNLKSTFFVVGSRVISFPQILQTQYMSQHQIAVHTWAHPALTTLTNEQIIAELGWSRKVIKDVLGVTPNMMRPPFGDIDDRVRAISVAMGLTPVMWTRIGPFATFDTDDFNIHGGATPVGKVLENWEHILGNATTRDTGFIALEHDLFQQSVEVATGYILPDALAHNPPFNIQPVVACLNKPLTDAYIETNNNKTNPPAASGSAVTLSSGAPGSAQATSGADRGNTNAGISNASGTVIGLGLVATIIGMVAGFAL